MMCNFRSYGALYVFACMRIYSNCGSVQTDTFFFLYIELHETSGKSLPFWSIENVSSLDASSVQVNVPTIPFDYIDRNPDVTKTSIIASVTVLKSWCKHSPKLQITFEFGAPWIFVSLITRALLWSLHSSLRCYVR